MVRNQLVLKDGTSYINGIASKSSRDQLMIRIPGSDIVNVTITFSNREKTAEIICYNGGYKYTYTGFTETYSVQYFSDEDYVEIWNKPPEGVTPTVKKELILPEEYVDTAAYVEKLEEERRKEEEEESENDGE